MADPVAVPAAPGNANNVTIPKRTFNEVKTVSLAFVGDHGLLKDYEVDWKNAGSVFAKPEFTFGKKSTPISRTRNSYLAVKVEFEVWPPDAPQRQCTIKGVATWGQTFETKFPLKGGKQTVIVESAEKLPDKITKLAGDIEWTVDNGDDGPQKADRSWGHEVFVTMDKPLDDMQATRQEDGVTLKRMKLAMSWVEPVGSLKPHDILAGIRKRFHGYRLDRSQAVPPQFDHPSFLTQPTREGGAWAMVEYLSESGECQAQVRVQRALLRQVGVPGDARVYVVWAEPDFQGGKSAIEDDWEQRPTSGLNVSRNVSGEVHFAALVDGAVVVGTEYPPSHTPMPGGSGTSPGLNRYEACLRFAADGETKYYGGGAGVYRDKDHLLNAPTFWGLIWIKMLPNDGYKVMEIVTRY